jgi:hypothetical protein
MASQCSSSKQRVKRNWQSQIFRDVLTLRVGDVAVQVDNDFMDWITDYELVEGIRRSLRVKRAMKYEGHQRTRGNGCENVPPTVHCERYKDCYDADIFASDANGRTRLYR